MNQVSVNVKDGIATSFAPEFYDPAEVPPPLGVDLWVMQSGGVLIKTKWVPDERYLAWYPLPKAPAWLKAKLHEVYSRNIPKMIQQPMLPVVTDDNRILGTVRIVPTLYTGDETSVELLGVAYAARRVLYKRGDGVTVEFLGLSVTPTEERQGYHQHIPNFVDVSKVFHLDSWIYPPNIVQSPGRSQSALESLLGQPGYNAT